MAYNLSNQAVEDLKDIWFYGLEHWGIEQADNYLMKINEMCEFIFNNKKIGKNKSEIFEGLKSYQVNSHIIFYTEQNQTVYIIRFLHQSMDYEQHLLN